MSDLINRQQAIKAFDDAGFCSHGYIVDVLKGLPSAQQIYTDEEIQKMQDLESAEIEKAYQLGYEDGMKEAQPERKKGKWLVDEDGNTECPFCGNTCGFGNYCNECGADMRGESDDQ